MTDLTKLPAVSAIYRVRHNGNVIYVGQSRNLKQRWRAHHILSTLMMRYGNDWTIDWVEIAPHYLDRAEAFAYRHFQPVLNKQDPSALLGASYTQ